MTDKSIDGKGCMGSFVDMNVDYCDIHDKVAWLCQIDALNAEVLRLRRVEEESRLTLERVAIRGCSCSARGDRDWHGQNCYLPSVIDALRARPEVGELGE